MKTSLLLTIALFTSPFALVARADFVQDRNRISAEGTLMATEGTGEYAGMKQALVTEITTDGEGVTAYLVTDSNRTETFRVAKLERVNCGNFYTAVQGDQETEATLQLMDRSYSSCDLRGESPWTIEIQKGASSLRLKGVAEHYLLTDGRGNR